MGVYDNINGTMVRIAPNIRVQNSPVEQYVTEAELVEGLSTKQDVIQYNTLPTASEDNLGKVVQYMGTTLLSSYAHGGIYECVSDGEATPTYSWKLINSPTKRRIYNVQDYGILSSDKQPTISATTRSTRLQALIDMAEAGSVIYFPSGTYTLNAPITLTKGLQFLGDSIQKVNTSTEGASKSESQIIITSDFPANNTFITRNTTYEVGFCGLSFYCRSYSVTENSAEFTTLPYPYFVENTSVENVSAIDMGTSGMGTIKDCFFYGFSGHAIKVKDHRFIDNCGFSNCAIGIDIIGTDNWISNCWFCACGTAIHTGTTVFSNINISDCWFDQLAHHVIHVDNSSHAILLINNAWVDMIDSSAIYAPNAILRHCMVSGRFSRCGMMYAGIADADRTAAIKPDADIIYAKRIEASEFNITVNKREIGKGNNPNGVVPSKVVSTADNLLTDSEFTIPDLDRNDFSDVSYSGFSGVLRTTLHCKNNDETINNLTSYGFGKVVARTSSPIGRIGAVNPNNFAIDTTTKIVYRSTAGGNDANAWEILYQPTQLATIPTASANYLGRVVQYIGTTNANYTHGYFYECVSDGQSTPTYSWVNVRVEDSISLNTLQSVVAASSDFADFQTRIAAL